jgi:hypothetical protein
MQWYFSKNGVQFGPVSQSELCNKLATGEIARTELVWRDGMSDWIPAAQVPELNASAVVSAARPAVSSPYSPPIGGGSGLPDIPNYLWQAIVVTVLCCMPFGIPAIVYAAKVDGLKAGGDVVGAQKASANAKTWMWVSLGFGLAFWIIYGVLMVWVSATSPTLISR